MNTNTIGLMGYAGSGKDTVADHLVLKHGYTKMSFAAALRRECALAFPRTPPHTWTDRSKKDLPHKSLWWQMCVDTDFRKLLLSIRAANLSIPPSPRQIMQWWGTEYRRVEDLDYWTKQLKHTIDACDGSVVITDVRFPNEVALVKSYGGTLWRINRRTSQPVNAHVSETPLPFDDLIPNDCSLASLHTYVDIHLSQRTA